MQILVKKEYLLLFGILALFLVLRLPAIHAPYHQDEYKWPIIVNPALTEPGGIPHPPVGEFIYRQAGFLVGYDNFRIVPFVFGLLNLFLIFYLVKSIFDTKTALWTAGLFTISFFSLLASLMIDTDGAIMPFFALLSFIFYFKYKTSQKNVFLIPLFAAIILGFLTKISFFLLPVALALDFAFEKEVFKDKKRLLKYLGLAITGVLVLALVLYVSKIIFPFFDLESSIKYWEHFAKFGNRGWSQTFIQFAKALFYLSPLLVLTPFLADKEIFQKTRPFFMFIWVGLIFYLLAFDFSTGALDRYFQFLVVPLCVICGAIIAKYIYVRERSWTGPIFLLISLVIFALQFFNHFVPALHPKSEWVGRIFSLKWNFLYPFSGGSGPLTFYVSFAILGIFWIFGLLLLLTYLSKKDLKKEILLGLLVMGIFYNAAFAEEYLFGKINGYAPTLVRNAAEFIKNNPDIKKVVVYNDNGGREIMQTGKYEKRLYTSPIFDQNQKIETINNFSGYYLEIDAPPIDPNSIYRKYFDSCLKIYEDHDRYMNAFVYDCRNAPDIKNK